MNYSILIKSILLLALLNACATYQKNHLQKPQIKTLASLDSVDYSFYLIGDAGESKTSNHVLAALKSKLDSASQNTSLLFLGDNIYPKGMPKENSKNRHDAENSINNQLAVTKNFKGKVIFIPGNHDWYRGLEGLKRESDYIEKNLKNNKVFFPSNACPIEQIKINSQISIILIDSQWYLENWDKNPKINDDCSVKTREDFFLELEDLIKKNEGKTTLIAIHHPMFSNGPHGGQFSVKQQLKPLPILGSLVSLIRKTGGISPQDLQNKRYLELRKRLVTLAQSNNKVILVSGHEHNLQFLKTNNVPQIISGSGSKISPVRQNANAFGLADNGFAKLVVYKDGHSDVLFYNLQNNAAHLVYKTEVLKATTKPSLNQFPTNSNKTSLASIYSQEETTKKALYKKLWGERYRDYYSADIEAETANLDTLFGGLKPVKAGGGHQSLSLRLVDKKGREFVMRSLRKSATQYLQAVAFKDQNIEGKFENTSVESLLMDIFTGSHPYAPLVVGTLADGLSVFHTNPKLYYIPKQTALQEFNETFGDALYIVEERVSSGNQKLENFGNATKIISTNDLFKNLRKNSKYSLDEAAYIRARLFDMLIGDWDRHEDQWRWAEFEDNKGQINYKPIPRDRDQAFSIMADGAILGTSSSLFPTLRFLKSYDAELKSPKWFNLEPFPLDKALITKSDKSVWDAQVAYIQNHLTNELIEAAFNKMPKELIDKTIDDLKLKLKNRRQKLQEISDTYQKLLNNYVIIKGTDNVDQFDIVRLAQNKTNVKIYQLKKPGEKILFYNRTFKANETKELWIYGLDDDDSFNLTGDEKSAIKVRLIGGQNNDTYTLANSSKVLVYDYKSKKNTFKSDKAHLRLTDDYDTNVYNYKKPKYNSFQMLPSLGANKDDGLKIGLSNQFTLNKFERNPFTQQHLLSANYYLATSGYELNYSGEFAHIFKHWNFKLSSQFTSPNYSINFFGFGNDSKNLEALFDDDYNRVKIKTFEVLPALVWHGPLGGQFSMGLSYESKTVENTLGRFVNTTTQLEPNVFKTQHFIGSVLEYNFENFDFKTFPTLGLKANLSVGFKANTNSDARFGFLIPSLAVDYKLDEDGKLVLATKIKTHLTFGDGFAFYQAASLGANDGLRGFRNQRFTGKNSFYQNTDLRLKLRSSHSSFIPIKMGIYGGFDYGRVWLKNDTLNVWNISYGGGFWFDGAGIFSSQIALFNSTDGALLSFGLGFGF